MRKLLKKTLWGYILTYAITFFIVIGLLIPIYSMVYNSSRRVIEQNLTSSLSAGTERLANALHAADLYAYSIMEQTEMVDIAYHADIKNIHLIDAQKLQKIDRAAGRGYDAGKGRRFDIPGQRLRDKQGHNTVAR